MTNVHVLWLLPRNGRWVFGSLSDAVTSMLFTDRRIDETLTAVFTASPASTSTFFPPRLLPLPFEVFGRPGIFQAFF